MTANIKFSSVIDFSQSSDDLNKIANKGTALSYSGGTLSMVSNTLSGTVLTVQMLSANAVVDSLVWTGGGIVGANTWVQTTQADFDAGVKTNVSTTEVVDSVVLARNTIFFDDFDRDDGPVENGWTLVEPTGGAVISTNRLKFLNPASLVDAWITRAAVDGQQNGITISVEVMLPTPSYRAAAVFVRATSSTAKNWYDDGYGWAYAPGTLYIYDNGVAKTSVALDMVYDTWYSTELIIGSDNAIEVRIWTGSRPETPTLSLAANTPASAGTTWKLSGAGNYSQTHAYMDNYTVVSESYSSPGTIASQVWDSTTADCSFTQLSWGGTEPASTDFQYFYVRAQNTQFAAASGTPSWTASGSSPTPPWTLSGISGQFFQWKAALVTTDTSVTPQLNDVTASFQGGTVPTEYVAFYSGNDGVSYTARGTPAIGATGGTIDLSGLDAAVQYVRADFTRGTVSATSPWLTKLEMVYNIDVETPSCRVDIINAAGGTLSTNDDTLLLSYAETYSATSDRLDTFQVQLDNHDGRYASTFAIGKDAKIYYGYGGTISQAILGIVDRVRFTREDWGSEKCILEGRSYEAKAYNRIVEGTVFTNLGQGEIIDSLWNLYLPTATSGITRAGVEQGEPVLDQSQLVGGTSRKILGSDGGNRIAQDVLTWYNNYSKWGQSFIAAGTSITSIWCFIDSGGGATLNATVRTALDGAILASKSQVISTGWNQFIFTTPATVTEGATYYIQFDVTAGSGVQPDYASNLYADGEAWYWVDSPYNYWRLIFGFPIYDFAFRIDFSDIPILTYGQTFTTGASVTNITSIDAYLSKNLYSGSGTVLLTLYTNTTKGTPVGTASLPASDVTSSADWNKFNFSPKLTGGGGTAYYFELTAPTDCTYETRMLGYYTTPSAYAGGTMYTVADGTPTAVGTADAAFRTYYITDLITSIGFDRNDDLFTATEKVAEWYGWDWYINHSKDLNFTSSIVTAGRHSFKTSAAFQNIEAYDIIQEGLQIKNYAYCEGTTAAVYGTAIDTTSVTAYEQRDLYLSEKGVGTATLATTIAAAKVAYYKNPLWRQPMTVLGLGDLAKGQLVYVNITEANLSAQYSVASVRHKFTPPRDYSCEIELNESETSEWDILQAYSGRIKTLERKT